MNILISLTTIMIVFVSVFAVVCVTFNCVYIKTSVRGLSMYPTLNESVSSKTEDGDKVYINKFSSYSNGDIVVAEVEWYSQGPIVKRLIGGPFDKVQIKKETSSYGLYVNSELIYEKEISVYNAYYYNSYLDFFNKFPQNVSLNEQSEKCIYLNENEYLLMGDNWESSTDCIEKGVATKNQILGKVDIIIRQNENEFQALMKEIIRVLF